MANSLLDRYQAGEREAVWRELLALGPSVREPEYLLVAEAVARETMKRARHNVEAIIMKLEKLGYWFGPVDAYSAVRAGGQLFQSVIERNVDQLRKAALSTIPLSTGAQAHNLTQVRDEFLAKMPSRSQEVRGLFDKLEGSKGRLDSLLQGERRAQQTTRAAAASVPQLENKDVYLRGNADTLVRCRAIERHIGGPLPIALREWWLQIECVNLLGVHEALNPLREEIAADPLVLFPPQGVEDLLDQADEDGVYLMTLSPDALLKRNITDGEEHSISVPDKRIDNNCFYLSSGPGSTGKWLTFVEYLRLTFAWGGFPGWLGQPNAPTKELNHLRDGLLAI